MKNILLLVAILLALGSCKIGNENAQKQENESNVISEVYSVPGIMLKAGELIDKEIKLTGTVEHVCSHSGRRCFLIDTIADESIRVEATGEIESFGKELLGADIIVSGVLKEEQLKATEIDEWEVNLASEYENIENGGEKCASEMANIKSMREWMKQNNKDYYAIYYIDGVSYELVEQ